MHDVGGVWLMTSLTPSPIMVALGAPLVTNRDGPELQVAAGVLFLAFLLGATLQVRRLRTRS
jgi:hypothetical protein